MKLSKKMDRSGIAPVIIVGLIVIVILVSAIGVYLLYNGDQRSQAVWAPGANFDNAVGQIDPKTVIVQNMAGEDFYIDDYSSTSNGGISIKSEGLIDWFSGKLSIDDNATKYRVHYVLSPASDSWSIEQFVEFSEWGTLVGPDGNSYTAAGISTTPITDPEWNGKTIRCLPFIVKDYGNYALEITLETMVDGSWTTIDSETFNKPITHMEAA